MAVLGVAAHAQAPDFDQALKASQAAIGKPVGEHALRDREGRVVRLSDYRGKPLVVNFVYTGCFEVCPTTTRFLGKSVRSARDALGEDSFNVLTIGFNVPFDSPAAMAAFARQYGIPDRRWEFLSPDPGDVERLTRDFGFTYYATPKGFDHISQVTVVNSDGMVYRQVYGDAFDLPMLVGPLKELLSGQAVEQGGVDGLWTKVKLFCTVYDPNTGGYRVNYSLFVEIFVGLTVLGAVAWWLMREFGHRRV